MSELWWLNLLFSIRIKNLLGQHFAEPFFIHQPDCKVVGTFFQLGELTSDLKWEGRLSSYKVPFFFGKSGDTEASLPIPRPC